ncbi:MAG TPA: DNA internalization-related competence protein ComEC/Rec2 [Gemmatimonadales bacterium]|nr:DNA internalization-related competence protein ComEC/Rec2 [Gemmatimonadales bacterium]
MRPHPILLLFVLFEAGLATGLSRFPAPPIALSVISVAALLLHRRRYSWLPAFAALGFALGAVTRIESLRSCAALLPAAEITLPVRLLEPVTAGLAAAELPASSCAGAITLRARSERLLPAGTNWIVRGRWIPSPRLGGRPDGILVAAELSPRAGVPGPAARLRNWLTRTTVRLYGVRAGLVDALLVGRRGGIDPGLNAAFARSGLVHLLSISGFHVGIVFGWTLLLLRLLKLRRASASIAATAVVLGYTAFLGWPAPATRAALLCAAGAWSFMRQRYPAPTALLALTCLGVTLLDPWALFELGGWLSAAAFWGALTFTRWSDRSIGRGAGWRMLFASLGATLATAPLTAAAFGSVALAGIALNFLAIPLAAVAVPAVLASVLATPLFRSLASALAAGGGLGLALLEALARGGSALPLAAIQVLPGVVAALPWVGLLLFALWAMGRRNTSRRVALRIGWTLGVVGVVSVLPVHRPLPTDTGSNLALHFLSVGQGDAALLRTAAGHWILVDAGPADDRHDAGREVVLPFLIRHGVTRLALFVLSHAHLDHVGGALSVLREVPADLIVEPAEPVSEPHYLGLLDLAAERGYRWTAGRAGDSLQLDGVSIRLLHPDTTWARWREDLNDDSVVLLIRSGAFEAVLAGDLGIKAESLLAGRVGRVDLLKVGHHGSATSSGRTWLAELRPKAAVVSVGANRYGHPAASALARLAAAGVEVWRTDRDGTVSVTVGDSSMTLRGRRLTRQYSLRP